MAKNYDEAELLRVYDETNNNGRETARRLGLHRMTVQSAIKRLRGLCPRCGEPKAPKHRECETCLVESAARMRAKRLERSRLGLCQQCDRPRSAVSKRFCEQHRIEEIDWRRIYEEKKRTYRVRGIVGGQSAAEVRAKAVLLRYGQEGERRWRYDNASCQICDAKQGKTSVQLHHIDQNRSNNTFDNFACLCFDCHQSVHRLLDAPDPGKLLAWMREKYPGNWGVR